MIQKMSEAQPTKRTCGTSEVDRRLLERSAEYRIARSQIESMTLNFMQRARINALDVVTKIPVVVHVVWNTPEQNISDEQIQSQIKALNRDFRAKNPDITQVPDAWKDRVADSFIEFYLATQDPNGRPTNGITRTKTNKSSFITKDEPVKLKASGGADPWPADSYLNLWVSPPLLDGNRSILGYAKFPGGSANTDGVVIAYTAFGTTGTAESPFNLGRTATHEIGHWLNLKHIWGDDELFSDTLCLGSDKVDDTPNQGGPNSGNKETYPHISCDNTPNGDMFMNYMDYTDDQIMVMFTRDQVDRMHACLTGPRSTFVRQPALV